MAGAVFTVVDVIVVDVVVVDVDVDVEVLVDNGVDTSGLESWSSRAQPLAITTRTAARAGNFRTAAVFHDPE